MDIRIPVGALFATYGVLLILYSLVSGDVAPRHMIGGINVNLVTGIAMLIFGSIFIWLSRRGGSKIRPAAASAEGRGTEEREKQTGLEK
jgi:hypothetical protein